MIDDKKTTFAKNADETISEVQATYAQRGQEYMDSWALPDLIATFSKAVDKFERPFTPSGYRLRQCAALIDVKLSRMTGPYKRDTVIDLIAYLSCFAGLVEEHNAPKDQSA